MIQASFSHFARIFAHHEVRTYARINAAERRALNARLFVPGKTPAGVLSRPSGECESVKPQRTRKSHRWTGPGLHERPQSHEALQSHLDAMLQYSTNLKISKQGPRWIISITWLLFQGYLEGFRGAMRQKSQMLVLVLIRLDSDGDIEIDDTSRFQRHHRDCRLILLQSCLRNVCVAHFLRTI